MAPSLHQSLLIVSDLDASVEFYENVIGIEPDEANADNVEFKTGQCTFVLEEDFDQEVLAAFGLQKPGDQRGDGVIVAIDVDTIDTVDAVCDRAREKGIKIRMAPQDVDWGRRMALLADPDSYTVEVSASL